MILYANKKRDREFTLKERDKVYLLRRNIKIKRPSNKLNHTKLRSFVIKTVKESINYELDLSAFMRIHSIFHIFLLKSADSETSLQINSLNINPESQVEKYEVEEILDQQNVQGQSKYLVKWKGYEHIENTWEPEENLTNCQKLLQQFQRRNSVSQTLREPRNARTKRRREDR